MANQNASRDDNRVVTLLGVTDDSNAFLQRLLVDPTTGRLKVAATIAGQTFSDNETPSGTVNGSNATFSLAHSPSPTASFLLVVQGQVQLQGTDYTLSAGTLTYLAGAIPATNMWHRAWYRY